MNNVATYGVMAKALTILNWANRKSHMIASIEACLGGDGLMINFTVLRAEHSAQIMVKEKEVMVELVKAGHDKESMELYINKYFQDIPELDYFLTTGKFDWER